jgi:hypothetical protein
VIGGLVHFAPYGAKLFKVADCYKHFAPPEQKQIATLGWQLANAFGVKVQLFILVRGN